MTELASLTESDLLQLYSTKVLEIARDYVQQERLSHLCRTARALSGRVRGWSDTYEVRYWQQGKRLVGWCSEGRSRCRHLAALLVAFTTQPFAFLDLDRALEEAAPHRLAEGVRRALLATDPSSALLASLSAADLPAKEAGALPAPALFEWFLTTSEPKAAELHKEVYARLDELGTATAAMLVLAEALRATAYGQDGGTPLRRWLTLFPSAEFGEVLARRGFVPAAAVVDVLARRGERSAALTILELCLALPLGAQERVALLEAGLPLVATLPGRRRRYLKELLALGREDHLEEWLELQPTKEERQSLAQTWFAQGRQQAAVTLLVRSGMAREAADWLRRLPPEDLLAILEQLPTLTPELRAVAAQSAPGAPPPLQSRLSRIGRRR